MSEGRSSGGREVFSTAGLYVGSTGASATCHIYGDKPPLLSMGARGLSWLVGVRGGVSAGPADIDGAVRFASELASAAWGFELELRRYRRDLTM
ncbi:hypothetical protein [Sinosporangium siamense]|uniref:Uncharacterized protein n=1 Tax=Sinosporangium siamense TaxID=1367973 RepID=A0A919RPY4_9ACTN|nr:hypothetical protein [Sinosporangium siamense]GII97583.1 hypothetical protein Ssi02_78140 [Sinosporangium siamense]